MVRIKNNCGGLLFDLNGGSHPNEISAPFEVLFCECEMVILDCEIPVVAPSVNHYWGQVGNRCYLTQRAKGFQKLVSLHVKRKDSVARLRIEITVCFGDKRKRDIDNILKGVLDSLVKCGLCEDDEQFDEIEVKRGKIIKGGLLKIKVIELKNITQ